MLFICASDAFFTDNSIDYKSSQKYLIKLFGDSVAWRTNKQDTITTLSTKVELLIILQTAKKAIYFSCLIQMLMLVFSEPLIIKCNNIQTKRFLVDKSAKFQIKLCYMNIHSYWLRQKVQHQIIHICWMLTKKMVANGLTKALSIEIHKFFMEMTSIKDKKKLLIFVKKEKDFKDIIQQHRVENFSKAFGFSINASWCAARVFS